VTREVELLQFDVEVVDEACNTPQLFVTPQSAGQGAHDQFRVTDVFEYALVFDVRVEKLKD